jgi:predicted small secreted protein
MKRVMTILIVAAAMFAVPGCANIRGASSDLQADQSKTYFNHGRVIDLNVQMPGGGM